MAQRFYTDEKLGNHQGLTPEGFLVCTDVPVARTGTMIYGAHEVPIIEAKDGLVRITRDDEAVFHPTFLASLSGKSLVNDHPPSDVTVDNWVEYEVGVGLNPRRGTGMQSDLLLMDFVVKDKNTIDEVRNGKRQISLGYDADYVQTAKGEGRQVNLLGNHIAFVHSGRCGQRCTIGDKSSNTKGVEKMVKKSTVLDKLLARVAKAFQDKDEEGLEKAMEEVKDEMSDPALTAETGDTHVHVHSGKDSKFSDDDHEAYREENKKDHEEFRKRLDALEANATTKDENKDLEAKDGDIEGSLMEEAPEGTGDKARKARDSAYLEDSFQETVALAEILAPGIKIPTFDRNLNPKQTLDSICALRRKALDAANSTVEGRAIIKEVHGRELEMSGMKCNTVRTIFKSVAALKKSANKSSKTEDFSGNQIRTNKLTLSQINKRNAEIYSGK